MLLTLILLRLLYDDYLTHLPVGHNVTIPRDPGRLTVHLLQ